MGKASGTEPGSRVRPTRTRGSSRSPRSAGQETRLRVLRSLRPSQLTVVEMRQEASLRVPSPGWHCWVPCPLGHTRVRRVHSRPVRGPFSCSGEDDWGCVSRWLHLEGETVWNLGPGRQAL